MKKIFTFCIFTFALLIGTQTAFAQDKAQINEKAIVKTRELRSQLKFDENTLEKVYYAYQVYEYKLYSIENNLKSGSTEYSSSIKSLNKKLQSSIKSALGKDLFNRYLKVNNLEDIQD